MYNNWCDVEPYSIKDTLLSKNSQTHSNSCYDCQRVLSRNGLWAEKNGRHSKEYQEEYTEKIKNEPHPKYKLVYS